jgi:hypothetical protein
VTFTVHGSLANNPTGSVSFTEGRLQQYVRRGTLSGQPGHKASCLHQARWMGYAQLSSPIRRRRTQPAVFCSAPLAQTFGGVRAHP